MGNRNIVCPLLCAIVLGGLFVPNSADAEIEAIQGKKYRLTKRHGPWMIMVASLRSIPGKKPTAEEAADELVYELRRKGIPAYTFSRRKAYETIKTPDRRGRVRERVYKSQQNRICVLAGNYSSVDDSVAQKTLEYVKKLHPQSIKDGGIYRKTPGRPGPLSGAFLTINPMLSAKEVKERKNYPLLLKLNSGSEYSLLDNQGKYTLVVDSFYGKSATQFTASNQKQQKLKVNDLLYQAGLNAWQLTKLLREGHLPGNRNFEAYVFHGRYRSVVTIGSFNSKDDPRIQELKKIFGAKLKQHPKTGKDVLTAEILAIPLDGPPEKTFVFDPEPALMEVPRLR